ncbi:hypothetical protein OIU84_010998 [Salix udensis]|uniref:EF-hand domain-containing protein n=1 Tax=Salix udensis TaxID=889485 RepID=A0AAD6JM64_9ROSI|nr:hypothetical protein OIU84_010998 [Salix udensis]
MEAAAAFTGQKRTSSFSLRCPSLNFLRLRRIFDLFDKNGDGMITIQEISQALSLLGLEADFSELDFFGYDDTASEEEAADDTGDQARMRQEESDLSEAFKVFDEDGDGYISARELQVVLRKLGLPEAQEIDRIHQMITSVDRNQDGRVDFFEFKDMMRSVILVRSS